MLLRDELGFDTEDQAWPKERERLSAIAQEKLEALRLAGVQVEALELTYTAHLLLEAPDYDLEEERLWCIEFFTQKMYDYVVSPTPLHTCSRHTSPTVLARVAAAGERRPASTAAAAASGGPLAEGAATCERA